MRAIVIAIALLAAAPQTAPPAQRTPVVVELFTSEGCSSCPPADALLSTLLQEQPVPGVQIIPLELHVTYWDDLGWKDPASLDAATARQRAYARLFGADDIYTPQAVVDGRTALIGSDAGALRKAIATAASRPHAQVTLVAKADGASVDGRVQVAGVPPDVKGPLDVVVALVEDGITSAVARGENRGRTLHHDAVVRAIVAASAGSVPVEVRLPLRDGWQRDHIHAVAAVQERSSGHVIGAATTALR